MRAAGVTLPVHLGVPGVAEITKLMTIAARIGVADSARYLKKNRNLSATGSSRVASVPTRCCEELGPTLADPAADDRSASTSSRSTRSRAPLPGSRACLAR